MKAVFFNGPPGCGKDTAGRIVKQMLPGVRPAKFATKLKLATHAMVHALEGRPSDYPNRADMHEAHKDEMAFFGKTWRELYIAVSELLCKPVFGDDVFGKLIVAEMIAYPRNVYALTDSGFATETVPTVEHIGKPNSFLVRLRRDGCTFESDSRSYLDGDLFGDYLDIYNNGSKAELEQELAPVVRWMAT